jgi:hypothetical protein
LIKEHPTTSDRNAVEGKFKSYHNVSNNVAGLMAKTFFGLLSLAELPGKTAPGHGSVEPPSPKPLGQLHTETGISPERSNIPPMSGLHYNIQIHLPATKDVEVFNAIFKSLREHLFD